MGTCFVSHVVGKSAGAAIVILHCPGHPLTTPFRFLVSSQFLSISRCQTERDHVNTTISLGTEPPGIGTVSFQLLASF